MSDKSTEQPADVRTAAPIFPLAGWGIGLALHAWSTFGPTSKPITEDQIQREVKHLTER